MISGRYKLKDVSMYSGIPWAKVRHWVRGDLRKESVGRNNTPPLIKSDLGLVDGVYYLSFNDFIELKMIHSLREAGVSTQRIRTAYRYACEVFSNSHLFSTKHFKNTLKNNLFVVHWLTILISKR